MKKTIPCTIAKNILLFFSAVIMAAGTAHAGWSPDSGVPSVEKLRDIYGCPSGNLYAVGDYGTILEYDGTGWDAVTGITDRRLYTVWCSPEGRVFVGGDKGFSYVYDGAEWRALDTGTNERVRGIWGLSDTDVYAVGNDGLILHYDGNGWEPMASPTNITLQSVWGPSADNIYAVGGPSDVDGFGEGVIVNYNGTAWSVVDSPVFARLKAVSGTSDDNILVVGDSGQLARYDGVRWSDLSGVTVQTLRDMYTISEDIVIAVGDEGTIIQYDGTAWREMVSPTGEDLFGVWGASDSDIAVAGNAGTILRYTGQTDDNASVTCPFVLAVQKQQSLQVLRSLRDTAMTGGTGAVVKGLFNWSSAGISQILTDDPGLKKQLDSLVSRNLFRAKQLTAHGSVQLPEDERREMVLFLQELRKRACCSLKAAISFGIAIMHNDGLLAGMGITAE